MAQIEDLVLTVSRNTKNQVAVNVSYTIHFTWLERQMNIPFLELVELYEREGIRDDDPSLNVANPVGDQKDRYVALIRSEGVLPGGPGSGVWNPTNYPEKVARSWKKTLTPPELVALRDVGREHPYVKVRVFPNGVYGDSKIAELVIDIGDPGE